MSDTKGRRITVNFTERTERIDCFPSPKYARLIKAYAEVNEISDSKAGCAAIKHFIDNLPADLKAKVEARSKNTY